MNLSQQFLNLFSSDLLLKMTFLFVVDLWNLLLIEMIDIVAEHIPADDHHIFLVGWHKILSWHIFELFY